MFVAGRLCKYRRLLNSSAILHQRLNVMMKESFSPTRCQIKPHIFSAHGFDYYSQRPRFEIRDNQMVFSPLEQLYANLFDRKKIKAFENINLTPFGFAFIPLISSMKQPDELIAVNKNPQSVPDLFQLPSGLLYSPLIAPSSEPLLKRECVNDIQNRRRKMKKHKRRKWHKKFASLIRKFRMQREKKNEKKLQELLELWRSRSEAWDPAAKIERRLMFARRSGYYDIKPTEAEGSNPVTATLRGQRAILEATSVVRDLTLALDRVYENVRDTQGTKHLNAELSKNFKDRVNSFQHCRNVIRKISSQFGINNPEDLIPYADETAKITQPQDDSEKVTQLKAEREILLEKIAEADSQLQSFKDTLTSALWELNDLTHSTGD